MQTLYFCNRCWEESHVKKRADRPSFPWEYVEQQVHYRLLMSDFHTIESETTCTGSRTNKRPEVWPCGTRKH